MVESEKINRRKNHEESSQTKSETITITVSAKQSGLLRATARLEKPLAFLVA